MNTTLSELVTQLNADGIDLSAFAEVHINLNEARETVITCRGGGFEPPEIFVQGESGHFYPLKWTQQDALKEIRLQNAEEKNKAQVNT